MTGTKTARKPLPGVTPARPAPPAPRRRKAKHPGGWCVLFPRLVVRTTATEAECREHLRASAGLMLAMSMTDAELAAWRARQAAAGPR